MNKNIKIALFLLIGCSLAFIFLQTIFIFECRKTERRLAEIEQMFAFPESILFSTNQDTLYFFSRDKIFTIPLSKNLLD